MKQLTYYEFHQNAKRPAYELIAEWERNNARVTVDPLPQHRYRIEVLWPDGHHFKSYPMQLRDLLKTTDWHQRCQPRGTYLVITKDGDFFTAKEV